MTVAIGGGDYFGKPTLTTSGAVRYGKVWALIGRKKEKNFVSAIVAALKVGWKRLKKVEKD
jgi:hypothetical protein